MCGRGESEYARVSSRFALPKYVRDVTRLLAELDTGPVAVIGTSMGGLMAMTMAASGAWPLAGVVLNDIGPELDPVGLARIGEYVGQGGSFATWMHAARHLREMAGAAHPDYAMSDWLGFAKRVMCVGSSGRIAFDYDMKIAEPFAAPEAVVPGDLWPAFRALAGNPLLVLRGELSDLLSAATLDRMQAEIPAAETVTVPRVGHPPTLAEPESLDAIARWLGKLG
jgi:pimeloyl-ACP methyl ester carboxylesterase